MNRKIAIAALGTLLLAGAASANPEAPFAFNAEPAQGGQAVALFIDVAPMGGEEPCHIVFTPAGGDPTHVATFMTGPGMNTMLIASPGIPGVFTAYRGNGVKHDEVIAY